jgi:hypothetical protein
MDRTVRAAIPSGKLFAATRLVAAEVTRLKSSGRCQSLEQPDGAPASWTAAALCRFFTASLRRKAAEGCRSPKPRGTFRRAFRNQPKAYGTERGCVADQPQQPALFGSARNCQPAAAGPLGTAALRISPTNSSPAPRLHPACLHLCRRRGRCRVCRRLCRRRWARWPG